MESSAKGLGNGLIETILGGTRCGDTGENASGLFMRVVASGEKKTKVVDPGESGVKIGVGVGITTIDLATVDFDGGKMSSRSTVPFLEDEIGNLGVKFGEGKVSVGVRNKSDRELGDRGRAGTSNCLNKVDGVNRETTVVAHLGEARIVMTEHSGDAVRKMLSG